MPLPTVTDADVLFGGTTRGLLINLGYAGLVNLHWSDIILDETHRALVDTVDKNGNARMTPAQAQAHVRLMNRSLPAARVTNVDLQAEFEDVWTCVNSAKDMHVAACAHAVKAYYPPGNVFLVTRNLGDYIAPSLAALGIQVRSPDAFLQMLWQKDPKGFAGAFRSHRLSLVRTKPEVEQLLEKLTKDGQATAAADLLLAHNAGTHAV